MNKKIIALVAVAVVVIVAIIGGVGYMLSLQKVTITYEPKHGKVQLVGERLAQPIDVTSGQEMTLPKGTYQIKISGDQARHELRTLVVQDAPITQTVPISLPDKKLEELRAQDFSAIQQVVLERYPTLLSLYTFNDGKLYDRGQWYATTLTYKGSDTENRDTLRLVAEKQAGQWKLITTSIRPLVSRLTYPSIPRPVLDDINRQAYLPGTATSPEITPGQ